MQFQLETPHFNLSLHVDPSTLRPGAESVTSTPDALIDPTNPNNPYDEIGSVHNVALDYLGRHLPAEEREDSEAIDSALAKFLPTFAYESQAPRELLAKGFDSVVENLEKQGILGASPFGYSTGLTKLGKFYEALAKAEVPMRELERSFEALERTGEVAQFVDDVRDFERKVLSLELPEAHRLPLLAATSVARYSATYWDLGGPTTSGEVLAKGGGVVFADAFGALKGAFTGGWFGAAWGGVKSSVVKAAKNAVKRKLLPPKE